MKKIFSSLLLFSLIFSVKAPKISNVALNARPLAATNIDYTSRLNQAGIELNKSKADLLKEINASEQ